MKRAALATLLLLAPAGAKAHPVDEVIQGAYLTLAPGQVQLELDLTPGSQVAPAVLQILDANADRRITDAEARAYAQAVLRQSTLTVDGAAARWTLTAVEAPPYPALAQASGTLKIYATADRPDRAGARTIAYENRYQPAKSQPIANIFLKPGPAWRYLVTNQQRTDDGRRLEVRYVSARP